MIVSLIEDMATGALGGVLDGYLRERPLADSALTGLVIRASQAFACTILALCMGCIHGTPKDVKKFAAVARFTCIVGLALRVGMTFAAFRLGYIGKVVGWTFVGLDILATLKNLRKISSFQALHSLATYVH